MTRIGRIITYPFRLLDSVIDRIVAIIGAMLLSQVPGFISHYVQRLGGHVAEARRNVQSWQEIADKTTNGSLDVLVQGYLNSDLQATVEAGNKCMADMARFEGLRSAMEAINNSTVLNKGFVFLKHVDMEIARGTAGSYVPNLPFDLESLAYAAAGLLLAMLLYQGLKFGLVAGVRRIARRRRSAPPVQDPGDNTPA